MTHQTAAVWDWSGQTNLKYWIKGDAGSFSDAVYRIWIGSTRGVSEYHNTARTNSKPLADLDPSGGYVTITLDTTDSSVWDTSWDGGGDGFDLSQISYVWVSLWSSNGQGESGNPSKLWVDDIQAVPEPGSLFLLGTGLLGLVSGLRRKMRG